MSLFILSGLAAAASAIGQSLPNPLKGPMEITTKYVSVACGGEPDLSEIYVKNGTDQTKIRFDLNGFDNKSVGEQQQITVTAEDGDETVCTSVIAVVYDDEAPELLFPKMSEDISEEVKTGVIYLELGKESYDPLDYVTVTDNSDADVKVAAEGTVDAGKLGEEQTVIYKADDGNGNQAVKKAVFVVEDTTDPEVTVKKTELSYGADADIEKMVEASDNSGKVTISSDKKLDTKKLGEQTLKITAEDPSGNQMEKEVTIQIKDQEKPELKLKEDSITVEEDTTPELMEYVASCMDNVDGDLTDKVSVSELDTSETGTYTVTYSVKDSSGNKTEKTMEAVVLNTAQMGDAEGLIKTAMSKLGCPYVWGATGPDRFDCSGFTQWVYARNGISIPRTSSDQHAAGQIIPISELKPGDIVWRSGHVGLYVGGDDSSRNVIHAPHSGDVVRYTNASGFTCGLRF